MFNVCRGLYLTQNEMLSNLIPSPCIGSAACLVRGTQGIQLGMVQEPLEIVDENR